jgi:hypothetical protein
MNTLKDTIAAFDKQKAENLPGDILRTMDETTDAVKPPACRNTSSKAW